MTKIEKNARQHPAYESISDERNNDSGIWLYLKAGWHSGEYEGYNDRLHQLHEDTWTGIANALRNVKRCDCPECLELMKK